MRGLVDKTERDDTVLQNVVTALDFVLSMDDANINLNLVWFALWSQTCVGLPFR